MSSLALTGNASGAGVFTIASPNSASSYTATLPTATTTLVGTDATQTLTNKTLTTPNIDSAQFATVSGTAPIYPCRAWVNFNGTGTVAIRASGNVSSIGDNGTGDYTINFTTAMPDVNYFIAGSTQIDTSGSVQCGENGLKRASSVQSAGNFIWTTNNGAQGRADVLTAMVAVFR